MLKKDGNGSSGLQVNNSVKEDVSNRYILFLFGPPGGGNLRLRDSQAPSFYH